MPGEAHGWSSAQVLSSWPCRRLLRNRVSAQQARERKKSYVSNLEQRAREQEQSITEMEQRVNKLERENAMLRSVSGPAHGLQPPRRFVALYHL